MLSLSHKLDRHIPQAKVSHRRPAGWPVQNQTNLTDILGTATAMPVASVCDLIRQSGRAAEEKKWRFGCV